METITPSGFKIGHRRAKYFDVLDILSDKKLQMHRGQLSYLEEIDLVYRTLCGILYNFVPTSGHPGGSISSGRIVEGLLYLTMDYDFFRPSAENADLLVYAAGHKAMGLYAMWALRNELIRVGRPELLPQEEQQLRFEDLLGFRRNPTNDTPLFKKLHAKTLDGHPTPATPFVRIATGASGVGVPAALGLAFGALDAYGPNCPKVHILEGEGGMTPGRVHEALAAAASGRLHNAILHIDWNQASIDSNHVCREGEESGDYVQWDPVELCYCHDWNVIFVPNGKDFNQILAAQELALFLDSQQPTAIVYRTIKGWKYGIEGKTSHGAGHKFCSEGYYMACKEFEDYFNVQLPRYKNETDPTDIEILYYDTLMVLRKLLESRKNLTTFASKQILEAQQRLHNQHRHPRENVPQLQNLYKLSEAAEIQQAPPNLAFKPGDKVTLRAALGDVLNELNKRTHGAFIGSAADLLGSTSVSNLNKGFDDGLFNAVSNPYSRLIAVGGICEDAMGAFMAGLSSFGHHIGVTSSYGAFIGALEHVAARLHGIGQQSKVTDEPYNTWIMINAHAGVKTGEDGPTHADPQVLQLLQENFPKGVLITLTPWDAQEIWPLMITGLKKRPAILSPFVTRPPDTIVDRAKYGLPPASAAVNGVYAMRRADPSVKQQNGTIVLQGNGVATIFVQEVLQQLDKNGLNLNVFYIASSELFDMLPPGEQEVIFPETLRYEAMGITDFTLPTMYRWVRSNEGIRRTLHSFRSGHYLGSGQAHKVLQEAGIHAEGQFNAILDYARYIERNGTSTGKEKNITYERYPFNGKDKEKIKATRLTCVACGSQVDPVEYFDGKLPLNNEFCAECMHRDEGLCPYCMAHWFNANSKMKFYCQNCSLS